MRIRAPGSGRGAGIVGVAQLNAHAISQPLDCLDEA